MTKASFATTLFSVLCAAFPVEGAGDVREPVRPLATRVQEAEKVFVGVLINRKELEGDWCHADLKVTQAIKGVKVGELVPVLWRPRIARYEAKNDQTGLAVLKYQHEKRYWLRPDTFEDARLAEQAIKSLDKDGAAAPAPPMRGGPPAPAAKDANPGDAAEFAKLLASAALGKQPLAPILVDCRDADAGVDCSLYGTGVGFTERRQFTVDGETVLAVLKSIQQAGFADMPQSYGGVGRPGMGVPERLVRSLSVRIGKASKSVTQLAGGVQSKELADLIAGIHERLALPAKKGLDLSRLSLDEAVGKLARGELSPLLVSLAVSSYPRGEKKPNSPARWQIALTGARVTLSGEKYEERWLPSDQMEALGRRIGVLLQDKNLGEMPKQLRSADSLIGLDLSIRGVSDRLNLSADVGPYNQKMAQQHPKAQANFDKIIPGMKKIFDELSKPAEVKALPHSGD